MRAYGFGFCVIEGGFIVLIALNWGEGDALRGVLLAWLAVHIFLLLPIIAAIPESILGHIYERKGRAQLAAWRAANDRSSEASEAMDSNGDGRNICTPSQPLRIPRRLRQAR